MSPILTPKLVTMATFLKRPEKRVGSLIYVEIPTVPYGENLVKISPVDPEIIRSKVYFILKINKKRK